MNSYSLGETVYQNPLATDADVAGFRLEGEASIGFRGGRLRMENLRDPAEGQKSNFVFWCPETFAADVSIEWEFWPVQEPGLCILFLRQRAAVERICLIVHWTRVPGSTSSTIRDINALHVSYFRRRWPEERAFHTCNLRKSYGFHMVAQGADPIPSVEDATSPYRIQVINCGDEVAFLINELPIFDWRD